MSSIRSAAPPAPAPLQPQPFVRGLEPPTRRSAVRTAFIATVFGLFAFVLVQGLLAAHNLDLIRDAVDRGWLDISRRDPLRSLLLSLAYGSLSYLMLALTGLAIASRGHRLLFVLPAVAFVLAGVLVDSHEPTAIGTEWRLQCYSEACMPWFGHPWFGPLVDLGLVLFPGWALARSAHPRRWPGRWDAATLAAILVSVALVVTAGWAIAVIQRSMDLGVLVAVGALGLAIGVARPWWPWLHTLFAVFAVGSIGSILDVLIWSDPSYRLVDVLPFVLERTWPVVAVGLIASAREPLAWTIRRLEERPLRLAVAVNLLNLVDALLTLLAVNSGGAYESNPVVRLLGLPGKVVLVGLLTWFLHRRKPSALVWPFAALLWVAGYHVAGILVNG